MYPVAEYYFETNCRLSDNESGNGLETPNLPILIGIHIILYGSHVSLSNGGPFEICHSRDSLSCRSPLITLKRHQGWVCAYHLDSLNRDNTGSNLAAI